MVLDPVRVPGCVPVSVCSPATVPAWRTVDESSAPNSRQGTEAGSKTDSKGYVHGRQVAVGCETPYGGVEEGYGWGSRGRAEYRCTQRRDRSRSRESVDFEASGGTTTGAGSSEGHYMTVEERRRGLITFTPAISAPLSAIASSQRRKSDPRPNRGTLPSRDWNGGCLPRNEDLPRLPMSNVSLSL